jgi:hypothetical protein
VLFAADIVKFLLEAGADPNIDDGVIMDISFSLQFITVVL